MHKVHHLDAAVVVESPVQNAASRGADLVGRRVGPHEIIDRFEPPGPEVVDDLAETALGLAQEHGVGVVGHLLAVQHGGNPAEDDRHASGAKRVGNLKSAWELAGQHG